MKKVTVLCVIALCMLSIGCEEDNQAEIRANADDTYRYTHFTLHTSSEGEDDLTLHFINEYEHKEMRWHGAVRTGLRYLEQLDKNKCYKNPIDREMAVEVNCP